MSERYFYGPVFCIALLSILNFCGCAAVKKGMDTLNRGIDTVTTGVLDAAFSPLHLLTQGTAFSETRAKNQVYTANGRIKEWKEISRSQNIDKIFGFINENPELAIKWIPEQELIVKTTILKVRKAKEKYSAFLKEIGPFLTFKSLYESIGHSQANDDVVKLVDFVRNNRKQIFVSSLNMQPVRNHIKRVCKESGYSDKRFAYLTEIVGEIWREEEKPRFDQAKRENTLEAYDNYLREYPNGKYVSQIRRLREYPVFKRAERENTLEAYHRYLSEYPKGEYAAQAKKLAETPVYEQSRKKDTIKGYTDYLREYPNGKYAVQVSGRLNQLT